MMRPVFGAFALRCAAYPVDRCPVCEREADWGFVRLAEALSDGREFLYLVACRCGYLGTWWPPEVGR